MFAVAVGVAVVVVAAAPCALDFLATHLECTSSVAVATRKTSEASSQQEVSLARQRQFAASEVESPSDCYCCPEKGNQT